MTEASEAAAPPAPPTFADIGLSPEVLRAVDDMGFTHPTPVQAAAYAPAKEGHDLIVQARTGTGKTAAFGLPLVDGLVDVDGGPQVLILAPTRELALQSAREIGRLGVNRKMKTCAVYGGAPIERQVRELDAGAQIVSGTPGRVLDHLKRGTLDGSALKILVLDEADEMLSMGFARELNAIVALLPTQRQTMLFSATLDGAVERMAKRILKEPTRLGLSSVAVGEKSVTHYCYLIPGVVKDQTLVRILEQEDPESAIIFCNTKVATERCANALKAAGYNADWINGDLAQSDRERVLRNAREGKLRFMVATDVAARGIDISHVTHVINYDFPENIEAYIHRTGRTGRAGRTGTAIALVQAQDLGSLYYLRLQYGIFPIERSLPTTGEMQTRREIDRIELLSEAFPKEPSEMDRAVARRLLTHPDAERLLGGLVSAFLGTKEDVDEEAAAARRDRAGTPFEEPAPEPKKAKKSRPKKPKTERPKKVEAKVEAKPDAVEAAPAAPEAPSSEAPSSEDSEKPAEAAAAEVAPAATVPDSQDDAPDSAPSAEARADRRSSNPPPRRDDEDNEYDNDDDVFLYVNLGRRDGIRPGQIVRLFIEEGDVDKEDVGRIRIRDRHSFVGVPKDLADELVERLHGADALDKELVVEVARAQN
ncbi:MAG: DEAD/DEAH box helicase [Sandaracinaceae bacterium]